MGMSSLAMSPSGRDTNVGTSVSAPFQTIPHAAALTLPGDTVDVMDGTYGNFIISRPGTSAAYITYQAAPGQHPIIHATSILGNGILINAASYISIRGFLVAGDAWKTTLAQALAAPNAMLINCIGVSKTSHHIKIVGNTVTYCPQAGIMYLGDYGWIYQNTVSHNAYWSAKQASGIAVENHPFDASTGSKMYIYNNLSYGNQIYVCHNLGGGICRVTDGNGIIIDSNRIMGYSGRVNIYNNVAYNNGCSGIRVFQSDNVYVYNNTTYVNNVSGTYPDPYNGCSFGGEITVLKTDSVRVLNNIFVGNPYVPMQCDWCMTTPTNLTWDYNIIYNGQGAQVIGPHDILVNPLFVPAGIYNFHLQLVSPAIGRGTSTLVPPTDFANKPRRPGSVDLGAYTAY